MKIRVAVAPSIIEVEVSGGLIVDQVILISVTAQLPRGINWPKTASSETTGDPQRVFYVLKWKLLA